MADECEFIVFCDYPRGRYRTHRRWNTQFSLRSLGVGMTAVGIWLGILRLVDARTAELLVAAAPCALVVIVSMRSASGWNRFRLRTKLLLCAAVYLLFVLLNSLPANPRWIYW